MNKIEHLGMGTCARIKVSQDSDKAEQKVKWFLKVHKTYKRLWQAYFNFFPKFLFRFTFYKIFHFHPPENEKQSSDILQHSQNRPTGILCN